MRHPTKALTITFAKSTAIEIDESAVSLLSEAISAHACLVCTFSL